VQASGNATEPRRSVACRRLLRARRARFRVGIGLEDAIPDRVLGRRVTIGRSNAKLRRSPLTAYERAGTSRSGRCRHALQTLTDQLEPGQRRLPLK